VNTDVDAPPHVQDGLEQWPDVTIIIPAYNAAHDLARCLHNIRAQEYPHERLHVFVIDDDSTDDTRQVAVDHDATVLRNGYKNIERGKSIGLAHAQSELIFLLDSDNRLPSPDWLRCAVTILRDRLDVVGVQAARFTYDPLDPPANRYCSLYGIGDPVAYYFRKQDHLSHLDVDWVLGGTLVERSPDCYLVRFTPENMPTVGSQGFLTRKSLLLQTDWTPALFHVDSNLELVAAGHDLYAFLRRDVAHDYVRSIGHLMKKLERNALLFYAQQNERQHVWMASRWTLVSQLLTMITVIIPLRDALRGYRKLRDPAWFLHPLLCVYVPAMYAVLYLRSRWRPLLVAPRTAAADAQPVAAPQDSIHDS
jgi:glycosyltransferase involved in cell wall biosynthesis